MEFILFLLVVIALAFVVRKTVKKIKIPEVVGLMLLGIIIGLPHVKDFFVAGNMANLSILGNIALFALMFLAGSETSWKYLLKEKRNSTFIAFFAAFTPLITGFLLFKIFGFSIVVSLIGGICMSITAEATKARVLIGLKKLETKLGATMIGAGIVDDFIGIILFVIVLAFLVDKIYFKEIMIVVTTIVFFFIGVFFQFNFGENPKKFRLVKKVILITIVPFFFVSLGINFSLDSLTVNPFLIIGVVILAMIGKISGTLLTKPITKFSWRQSYLIGWAMNSRGAIELALALIAFNAGLIPREVYSSLIVMALITTISFPFVIERMIKKYPKIMS